MCGVWTWRYIGQGVRLLIISTRLWVFLLPIPSCPCRSFFFFSSRGRGPFYSLVPRPRPAGPDAEPAERRKWRQNVRREEVQSVLQIRQTDWVRVDSSSS